MVRTALFGGLLVAFATLESLSFPWFQPVHSGDEGVWRHTGSASIFSLAFYTGWRPFTVPLLHKIAGWNEMTVIALQSALSVACWFTLAIALGREFGSRRSQLSVAVLVCLFSLSWPINQWDAVIRSESVFFSLLALTLALTLILIRGISEGRLGTPLAMGWAIAGLFFAGTREPAAYFLDLLWLALALWLGIGARLGSKVSPGRPQRPALVALALLAAGLAFCHWTTTRSTRWHTPLVNVVLQRVLPDDAVRSHWIEHYDFPRDSALHPHAGAFAWSPTADGAQIRHRLDGDPGFAADQRWLMERGVRSYQRYLVWDALPSSLGASFRALGNYANHTNASYAHGAGRTAWNWVSTLVLYPVLPVGGMLCLVLAAAAFGIAARSAAGRRLAIFTAFLATSAWAQAFVNFHGDAAEVARHMAVSGLLLRLAILSMGCAVFRVMRPILAVPEGGRDDDASATENDFSAADAEHLHAG